eukprot:s4902_g5.t1
MRLAGLHSGAPTLCMSATLALRLLAGYGSRARCSADHRLSPQIRTAMAPSTQQLAVAAVAAAGCTAFVAAPSTARGPALRSATQGRAASSSSSSSSTGLAICGLGAAVGAAIAVPKKERVVLRAFETELGVQPPAGFWDPLGFTKGGDAASFRRRRYVELKHGRVAMLACLGYIVP